MQGESAHTWGVVNTGYHTKGADMKHQPADYCKGSDKFSGTFGVSACPVCGGEYTSTQSMRVRRHLTPAARSGDLAPVPMALAVDVCGPNAGQEVTA